jgi:hypothetical protein
MTVLEASRKSLVLPLILADKLGVGHVWIDRLLASMEYEPTTGCWIWQKAKVKGYGMVRIRKQATHLLPVHRLCYELAHGRVPKDKHVHHVVEEPIRCMGRACGNPEHTKPVSPREHIVELTPGSASNIAAHRGHCARGHEYTPENTIHVGTNRRCRTCLRLWSQQRRDNDLAAEGREKFKWREQVRKTHCKRGHEFTEENTYLQGSRKRSCLMCRRESSKEWQRKSRQK